MKRKQTNPLKELRKRLKALDRFEKQSRKSLGVRPQEASPTDRPKRFKGLGRVLTVKRGKMVV